MKQQATGALLPILEQQPHPASDTPQGRVPLDEFFRNISSVTVKVTGGCNLKCKYCNVDPATANTPKMSMPLWKHISDLVIRNSKHERLSIEFHGGEPLLLGVDFLAEASRYTYELGEQLGKNIDVPMVTNGTLLKAEHIKLLKESGVGIAISCDGPPHVNDRVRGGGKSVERAIRLLRDEDYLGGVMTVVSESNFSDIYETMDWFRSLGVHTFAVNFIQPQGRGVTHGILSAEQMYASVHQIFEHMHHTGVSVLEHKLAQQINRFIHGRPPRSVGCWDFECQAGKTYVSIDLHGQIHACGSEVTNHILGRIGDGFIEKGHCNRKMVELHRKSARTLECFDCHARRICDHSCPTADFNTLAYAEAECKATKMTWKYFCDNAERVRQVYSQMRRFNLN